MRQNNRAIGTEYEKKAGLWLTRNGYEVLEYNFRCRSGEIDIIAKEKEYLVFCEVKFRSNLEQGYPAEAVDRRKQRVLSKCALYYLTTKGLLDVPCRFDVLSIAGKDITIYKNAFDYIG